MPPTIQNTIEEFDKQFMNNGVNGVLPDNFQDIQMLIIKDFLIKSLTSQAQMMVKIVEGKIRKHNNCEAMCDLECNQAHTHFDESDCSCGAKDYNQALSDILTSYKDNGLIK